MAVATGMISVHVFITDIARVDMPTHDLGTAELDVLHRLFVALEHTVAVLRPVGRAVFPEDVG
jgi:hypothetical protein